MIKSTTNGVKINTVNTSVLLTVLWTFTSLFFIYGGYKHCGWYSYKYTFECNKNACTWIANEPGRCSVMSVFMCLCV